MGSLSSRGSPLALPVLLSFAFLVGAPLCWLFPLPQTAQQAWLSLWGLLAGFLSLACWLKWVSQTPALTTEMRSSEGEARCAKGHRIQLHHFPCALDLKCPLLSCLGGCAKALTTSLWRADLSLMNSLF